MDFLTVIHIIIAIILILLVLVQDSKGAMGGTFGGGGGSHTLFGATGAENVLTKSTKTVVIFFAITCILLTRLSSQNRESVLDTEGHRPTQPIQQEQPASDTSDQTNEIKFDTKAIPTDGDKAVPVENAPVENVSPEAEDVKK